MQISVETLSDETITLEVEPSLSIRNVKILLNVRNKLVKGEWCPPNEHRLTFAGRELEDNHTLSYYGIQNDCLLHVVPRYRGGDQDETSSSSSDGFVYYRGRIILCAYSSRTSQEDENEILFRIPLRSVLCCICTERYRQPKVLPCQHTFCLSCLELCLEHHVLSQSGKLKCPICRDEHSVPSGGVQAFPSNYTIIDLLNNPALVPQASDNEEIQNGGMQIFVKTLTGKTIPLNVQPSDSVEMLKERIFDREGIRPAEQILICNGRSLHNGKTLSFFKIEGGSTVHLTARCVGGHYSHDFYHCKVAINSLSLS
uniref:RING-type domain-containing protein n=1 Tax=Haemonchus contortus TaxID=6289 RepID=A0A7I4YN55_HAECO